MRIDTLTTQFQNALADAQSIAVRRDHPYIEAAHVLSALLATPASRPPAHLRVRAYKSRHCNAHSMKRSTASQRCAAATVMCRWGVNWADCWIRPKRKRTKPA